MAITFPTCSSRNSPLNGHSALWVAAVARLWIPPQESAFWIYYGNGDASFHPEKYDRFEAPLDPYAECLYSVDLNNDGAPDLILLNTGTMTVWVSDRPRTASNGAGRK